MKRFNRILGTAISLLLATAATGTTAEPGASYQVTINDDNHRVAIVTAALEPTDKKFYMFPGANEFPARWATFVSEFAVYDDTGSTLPVSAAEDGTWTLSSLPEGPVTIRYQVNLDHESHDWSAGIDGAAYARDWGVFYTARSLFVANGDLRTNIHIDFQLPESWRVTVPWQELDNGMRYVVPDHEALANSILFAGQHEEVLIDHGSFSLLLALGGDSVAAQREDFVEMATGVLDYYTGLMGDLPRIGSPHNKTRSVVVISEGTTTDGEAIGNHISMLLQPDGDPMSHMISRLLFAHEFFHLWNGKSFTPDGLNAEWFKEGFSNYYTLKAMHHIGVLNDESFLGVLSGVFYQRYESDPAVGHRSITEGELKHSNWGLIYSGGLLVAIAQDLQVRTSSGNAQSLDDLMRHMFDQYSEENYDLADIERELSRLNDQSQADFFRRYIHGTEKIPLEQFLALAGIDVERSDGNTVFTVGNNEDPEVADIRRGFFGD
jgi:predicted metalloprotease with PDZ domain